VGGVGHDSLLQWWRRAGKETVEVDGVLDAPTSEVGRRGSVGFRIPVTRSPRVSAVCPPCLQGWYES
jgi:hypothetical protein